MRLESYTTKKIFAPHAILMVDNGQNPLRLGTFVARPIANQGKSERMSRVCVPEVNGLSTRRGQRYSGAAIITGVSTIEYGHEKTQPQSSSRSPSIPFATAHTGRPALTHAAQHRESFITKSRQHSNQRTHMASQSTPITQLAEKWNQAGLAHPQMETAIAAVNAGAIALMSFFQTDVAVQTKGIANYVSEADFAAESAVVNAIKHSFPSHAIISEESHRDLATANDLWIIDPLDGTSNFLHHIPHFAVSLAYYQNGAPQIGIVCNPVYNDWYITIKNCGAWHNLKPMKVATCTQLDQAMIATGFYYDRGRMMEMTLETIGDFFRMNVHGVRRFGAAALDLCNLADGQYGVFFEYKLHPWDYAAGQLILAEAGGIATNCDNKPLPLDTSSSICASNGLLHSEALQVIAKRWTSYKTTDNH